MTLPDMMQVLRKRTGLSKQDLAARLGIGLSTVHSWETSEGYKRAPTPRNLQAILDAAGATGEQRAEAWRLLAEDGATRKDRAA